MTIVRPGAVDQSGPCGNTIPQDDLKTLSLPPGNQLEPSMVIAHGEPSMVIAHGEPSMVIAHGGSSMALAHGGRMFSVCIKTNCGFVCVFML